jgi:FlaG/FlaF family flagellin (archaellin)
MKGISDVIAMLLMLVITIGLVGLSYSYITGIFTARTAVVLNIVPEASSCTPATISVVVRNDGTTTSGAVNVSVTSPTGGIAMGSCSPSNIPAGQQANCPVSRGTTLTGPGYYRVVASTSGSTAQGIIYCAS